MELPALSEGNSTDK